MDLTTSPRVVLDEAYPRLFFFNLLVRNNID